MFVFYCFSNVKAFSKVLLQFMTLMSVVHICLNLMLHFQIHYFLMKFENLLLNCFNMVRIYNLISLDHQIIQNNITFGSDTRFLFVYNVVNIY